MAMKIYTKTGDKGTTSLIGGTRVSKAHLRIEAYGTVDELNSYIGLCKDVLIDKDQKSLLQEIQDRLFTIGSHLAADPVKNKMELPPIQEDDITALEKAIDHIDGIVPEMKSFVLPGGHIHVSYCHVARCVCRRAERAVLRLAENEKVEDIPLSMHNRIKWLEDFVIEGMIFNKSSLVKSSFRLKSFKFR